LKRQKVISSFGKVQSALAIVENLSSIYVVPSYFSCGMFGGLSSMAEVRNLGTQAASRKAFWNAAPSMKIGGTISFHGTTRGF